jgi:hypothetical protein
MLLPTISGHHYVSAMQKHCFITQANKSRTSTRHPLSLLFILLQQRPAPRCLPLLKTEFAGFIYYRSFKIIGIGTVAEKGDQSCL